VGAGCEDSDWGRRGTPHTALPPLLGWVQAGLSAVSHASGLTKFGNWAMGCVTQFGKHKSELQVLFLNQEN
jgi:hypothetical protein